MNTFYLELPHLQEWFLIPLKKINSQWIYANYRHQRILSRMTRLFLYISREKNFITQKADKSLQHITRLTSRNSTYKKISDFISELLVKYSKTNIFCAECFLHACQVFDWPCEDMSDKVLQTFDVRWQSSLYDKLLIHRSVLMHSCPWRLWLMRLPEFYG